MKWYRPLPGQVLFSYPALHIRTYLWSIASAREKPLNILFAVVFFLWFCTSITYRKLQPFDFWDWLATMAKDAVVLGIAYLLVKGVVSSLLKEYPSQGREHYFHKNSAVIDTGAGKSRRRVIYPDTIRDWNEKEIIFEDIPFYLFTVSFKDTIPSWLPDRTVLRFGIPKSEDLTQLIEWAKNQGLTINHGLTDPVGGT